MGPEHVLVFRCKHFDASENQFEKLQIEIGAGHISVAHFGHTTKEVLNKDRREYGRCGSTRQERIANYLQRQIVKYPFDHIVDRSRKYLPESLRVHNWKLNKNIHISYK